MAKTEEKLKKEVGQLYLFANLMYGDALDSIGKKKKASGFEEERLLEYVDKSIKESVGNYFKDFNIDEKFFEDFNETQRKHLVSLSKNIDAVKREAIEDIVEEIFIPLAKGETAEERERSLGTATEKNHKFYK